MQRVKAHPLRRGMDAVGLARAGRRTGRLADAAHRARRGARGPRPGRPGDLLARRGARPHADRLRAAGARGRGRAAPALRRGDVVPGLLRAGHRERPRVAQLPADSRRRRRATRRRGSSTVRRSGRASPSTRSAASLLTRTGTPDSRHRGITAFFVDMDTPGINVSPLVMINGVPEFAEVFFDDVVGARRSDARRAARRVGGRHEHPPVRTVVVLLAAHRVPLPSARAPRRRSARRRRSQRRGRRRRVHRSCFALRARSRATQHRLAAGATLGAETSIDKVLVATGGAGAVRRRAPAPAGRGRARRQRGRRGRGGASTSTRARRRSTAAPPRCSATSSPGASSTSGATD